MKRIFLFLATNAAVLVVISVVLHVFGVNQYLTGTGIDYQQLLGLSAVVGFAGAIFSLLISKPMAKMSTGAKVIDGTEGEEQRWLVRTVRQLADRAGIGHPDVAMYEGAPNHPYPDRWWRMIDKYGITVLYTSPTAIRGLMRYGESWVKRHDISSLRLLGSVGEPINPEAWRWYHDTIGREMSYYGYMVANRNGWFCDYAFAGYAIKTGFSNKAFLWT